MNDRIIGICRFSFLGKGDWIGTRRQDEGDPVSIMARAPMLYAPERMAQRMHAFEQMLLPAIKAQTDPDFELWMLTSPELPAEWMARLQAIAAEVPQIRLIVSAKRTTDDALRIPLRQASGQGPILQFRIDDDDALSRYFVARLRRNAARMSDLPAFGISLSQGLIIRAYRGEPLSYWRTQMPFMAAGAAMRLKAPGRNIYAPPHFDIPRRFPALSDAEGLNYVMIRWEHGNSAPERPEGKYRNHVEISRESFLEAIAADFPFLAETDFSFILQSDQR